MQEQFKGHAEWSSAEAARVKDHFRAAQLCANIQGNRRVATKDRNESSPVSKLERRVNARIAGAIAYRLLSNRL